MSKGLESLKTLGEHHCSLMQKYESEKCLIPCNKCSHLQEEETIEKELKALKSILKKDFIDLKLLKRCKTHYDYNRQVAIRYSSNRGLDIGLLTEEEFGLLKEVSS